MPQVGLLLGAVAGGPRAPFAPCCPTRRSFGMVGGACGWVAGRAGSWECPTDLGLGCWGQSPDP